MERVKIATIHRLIKEAGAERVSKEAAIALGKVLNRIGTEIAKEAIEYAHYAKRKTVKPSDIEMAYKKFLKRSL